MEHIPSFVILVGCAAAILFGVYRTLVLNKLPYIRRIAGLEAIDEGVNRCVEMGTGAVYHSGTGALGGTRSLYALLGIAFASFFTRKTARAGVKTRLTTTGIQLIPLMRSVAQEAYLVEGRSEDFNNPEMFDIRYYPFDLAPLAIISLVESENLGFVLAGGASRSVMNTIGGGLYGKGDYFLVTAEPEDQSIPWAIAFSDYAVILQENYAASSLILKDKAHLGSIIGMDIFTWVMVAATIIVSVVARAGVPLAQILGGA